MNTNTLIDRCELSARWDYTHRRVGPAYLYGKPAWMWQAAMCRRRWHHRGAAAR